MAFKQANGRAYAIYMPKAASTVFAVGDLVYANGTGEVTPATVTSDHHLGICQKAVAAADADFAATTSILLSYPVDDTEFLVPCTGATADLIGTFVDLTDAGTADVAASAVDTLLVTGVISSTLIKVKINNMASYRNPS